MSMLITDQVIAFCYKLDFEYQIKNFESICTCENS